MDISFFSYAVLIEIILLLSAWIGFIHWRLSKKKKELTAITEAEEDADTPFEVYMQYLTREVTETKAHLDSLHESSPDDQESITMYDYRLKHLEAEQKAMTESKGEVIKFWEIYRSNVEFIYTNDEQVSNDSAEVFSDGAEVEAPETMVNELDSYKNTSSSIIEQSNNVIELIQNYAKTNDSEELTHMVELLSTERDQLEKQLQQMEDEYSRLMTNTMGQSAPSTASTEESALEVDREEDAEGMSKVLSKQNSRISELSNIVGNLSLELDEKKKLMEETEWVTRQLKETEQVVVILEDENSFLRDQVKMLLE